MSRAASAVPNSIGSFAAATLVGSAVRDRRTGLRTGLVAGTVAAVASRIAYGVAAAVDRNGTETVDDVAPNSAGSA